MGHGSTGQRGSRNQAYNRSSGAQTIEDLEPAEQLCHEHTLLNAVTATGAGAAVDVDLHNNVTIHYIASSTTVGATIKIQGTLNGTDWFDLDTEVIAADGVTEFNLTKKYKSIRANVTAYTDGTYTVLAIAGR